MNKYTISGSPHVHSTENTRKIMYRVLLALVPALMLTEWLIQKFLIKGPLTINDGSAALTGLLLAFNVPANLPIWMAIVGSIVAIGIGKMAFGGLGKNPFNPALVGRVFMLVSFPTAMTTWPQAAPIFDKGFFADAVTGPTPLGILKEAGVGSLAETGNLQFLDMVLGNRGGAFGEVCAIALLLGAIYLICRKVIEIFTPLSILLTVFVFTGICYLIDPTQYIAPWYHLVYGGLILGYRHGDLAYDDTRQALVWLWHRRHHGRHPTMGCLSRRCIVRHLDYECLHTAHQQGLQAQSVRCCQTL